MQMVLLRSVVQVLCVGNLGAESSFVHKMFTSKMGVFLFQMGVMKMRQEMEVSYGVPTLPSRGVSHCSGGELEECGVDRELSREDLRQAIPLFRPPLHL